MILNLSFSCVDIGKIFREILKLCDLRHHEGPGKFELNVLSYN